MIKKTIEILTAIGLVIPCICELLRKVDEVVEKTNAKINTSKKSNVRSTTIDGGQTK